MARADYPLVTDDDVELLHNMLEANDPHISWLVCSDFFRRMFPDAEVEAVQEVVDEQCNWGVGDFSYWENAATVLMILLCELGEFDGYLIGEEE